MNNTPNYVFKGLQVVAWIIFIGLLIETGGLAINFVVSLINPEMVGNLYNTLDLSALREESLWLFVGVFSLVLAIAGLKASLFYQVVTLIGKIDLTRPFSAVVSQQINNLAYYTFSIGMISYLAREVSHSLEKGDYYLDQAPSYWGDSQAYLLMAAVIYLIAFIFKKGLELQVENDLTV